MVAACLPDPQPLVGTWVGEGEAAGARTFVFREDGSALWSVAGPGGASGDFEIAYRYDGAARPRQLDLFGFDRGPFQGQVLYCIVELRAEDGGDVFAMDCEAAPPGTPEVRPAEVTGESVVYRRVE